MADWFETRFREPVEGEALDPTFAARMRALVVEEWQADAGSTPSDHSDADDHEGDVLMLETEDRPTGDKPASPRRGLSGRWLLAAAAVAVIAVVGALLAAGGDDDNEMDTVVSTPTGDEPTDILSVEDFADLEPGRYVIDPDGDPSTPLRVTYEVTAEGWSQWIGAARFRDDGHVGLSITTVTNVVRDACRDHRPADPAIGPTVDDLAAALTQLVPFVVTSPPTDVTIQGYQGKHLALVVPDLEVSGGARNRRYTGCESGNLNSWIAPLLGGSYYGYGADPGHTEAFWILDVDGTRLVIETNESPDSPPQDLAERQAIFDSIRIEP
jgi:hypothetical protein